MHQSEDIHQYITSSAYIASRDISWANSAEAHH